MNVAMLDHLMHADGSEMSGQLRVDELPRVVSQ